MTAVNLQFAHINDADAFSNLKSDVISFTLAGDNVVVTGIAGKRIYVFGFMFTVGSDTTLILKDGTSSNLTGTMTMYAGGSMAFEPKNVCRWQTTAGRDFIFSTGSNSVVGGTVWYQQY